MSTRDYPNKKPRCKSLKIRSNKEFIMQYELQENSWKPENSVSQFRSEKQKQAPRNRNVDYRKSPH